MVHHHHVPYSMAIVCGCVPNFLTNPGAKPQAKMAQWLKAAVVCIIKQNGHVDEQYGLLVLKPIDLE